MLMSSKNRAAKAHFMPNGFRLLSNGDHVLCAVTREKIMLEDLRYWSVEKQQAYSSAQISTQAALGKA
ncbi:MAG: DUF2093 domain-containing protein [Sphingorhabdus sp.]